MGRVRLRQRVVLRSVCAVVVLAATCSPDGSDEGTSTLSPRCRRRTGLLTSIVERLDYDFTDAGDDEAVGGNRAAASIAGSRKVSCGFMSTTPRRIPFGHLLTSRRDPSRRPCSRLQGCGGTGVSSSPRIATLRWVRRRASVASSAWVRRRAMPSPRRFRRTLAVGLNHLRPTSPRQPLRSDGAGREAVSVVLSCGDRRSGGAANDGFLASGGRPFATMEDQDAVREARCDRDRRSDPPPSLRR